MRVQNSETIYDQAYSEAVGRIQGQLPEDRALAKRVLHWVTNALRPLSVADLCHALAVEPQMTDLDPDNIPEIGDVISVTAGLVLVDEESDIVRLVHYTTQEYLERTQETWNPGSQVELASTCLLYLSFDEVREVTDGFIHFYIPFLHYAALYWGDHARTVQTDILEIFPRIHHDEVWISAISSARYYCGDKSRSDTYISILASFGLDILIAEHLSAYDGDVKEILIFAQWPGPEDPLSIAAQYGYESAVKVLIEKGAGFHAGYGHALVTAARHGREELVKILLWHYINAPSDPNRWDADCDYWRMSLSAGNKDIVKLLMSEGTEANKRNACGPTLTTAGIYGDKERIELLLDLGVDVNAEDDANLTALYRASEHGQPDSVQLLVDRGANVNVRGVQGQHILNVVLEFWYTKVSIVEAPERRYNKDEILAFLLDKVSNTTTRDERRKSFFPALDNIFVQIIQILINNGANIISIGRPYGSTPNLLAYLGATKSLRILHEQYHASPVIRDFYGRTALHIAAYSGHLQTFLYLLDMGYSLVTTDFKGDTPLAYAASGGSLEILDKILEMCPVEALPRGRWAPLHWAFRSARPEIIERLTEKGYRNEVVTLDGDSTRWDAVNIAKCFGHKNLLESLTPSCRSLFTLETNSDTACEKQYVWEKSTWGLEDRQEKQCQECYLRGTCDCCLRVRSLPLLTGFF